MKKCASCTKDLPDAALHCVFCGAKQPPAPVSTAGNAKTVMGYGGPEIEALRAQAAARAANPSSAPANVPAPAPLAPAPAPAPYNPPARPAAPSQPPPMSAPPTMSAPPPSGGGYAQPLAPAAGANSPTMFVERGPGAPAASPGLASSGPAPAGAFNVPPPGPATLAAHQPLPMPSAQPAPAPVAPIAPVPAAASPYASQSPARAGRPIEPWKDTLRTMMFVWGALLIAAFVVPLATNPMIFQWDAIIHGEGTQKLAPLILAAVGLLTLVLAALPLQTGARGALALILALAGIFVPRLVGGMPPWQVLVATVGMVMLPMGLLARSEYTDASLPRILITIGALATLTMYLVPEGNGSIPLVELFTGIGDLPGAAKILVILVLAQILLVVLALLCWLPSPATGGAKPIAWALILYPLVLHAAALFLLGDPGDIPNKPNEMLLGWIHGSTGVGGISVGVAYLALTGFGGASVIGKQLE